MAKKIPYEEFNIGYQVVPWTEIDEEHFFRIDGELVEMISYWLKENAEYSPTSKSKLSRSYDMNSFDDIIPPNAETSLPPAPPSKETAFSKENLQNAFDHFIASPLGNPALSFRPPLTLQEVQARLEEIRARFQAAAHDLEVASEALSEVVRQNAPAFVGQVMAFWDDPETGNPHYEVFEGMTGRSFSSTNGLTWMYCRPLTSQERGE